MNTFADTMNKLGDVAEQSMPKHSTRWTVNLKMHRGTAGTPSAVILYYTSTAMKPVSKVIVAIDPLGYITGFSNPIKCA